MDNRERVPMTDADRKENQPYDIDTIPVAVHQTKATKVINRAIVAALLIIALSLGVFLKWSFQSTNILEIHNSPFPARVVPDPTGKTGGLVFLSVDYCKNYNVEGTVRVSYLSASREQFTPVTAEKLGKGCNKLEVPVVIPINLSEDVYKVKFRVIYDLNPIKKNIIVDFESQPVTLESPPSTE